MRKVLNFVKGKREDKKEANLSLNVANISVEITDPTGITTPSDDYDFVGTTQQCTDYEVDLSGKDKSISKLHKAAWVGNLEKVKSHLKKIDINIVDASNRTPLHLAAAQGHTNVVWFLLSNKAQMDIPDAGGKTSFLKAVEGGYKEIVSNMLEKGADINSKDSESNTALHIATKLGYYDIATVLLKNGANFEGANKRGEYALHIATTAEHMDLVELLLRYGAAVNVTDIDARTPLMLAARCGNAPLVELFLEYGAKRDMVDNSSFTAQDYAINKGYGDLAALLVTATLERVEEEDKMDETETYDSPQTRQRSISSSSLLPANGSHQDVSDEPAEDGDSWNDSQLSESNKETKIPPSKLKKFLSPSSDDDLSEEQSPTKEGKNVHDSPNSCVIPPPLKPPRSWDLIQAGMIDDNTGSEVKRCSLTALGTLRSRRESFNDSIKSDLESPMSPKEGTDTKDLEKEPSKATSSSKAMENTALKRDRSSLSVVESDWDSDESLPLDKSAAEASCDRGDLPRKQRHQISVDVHHDGEGDLPAPPSPSQLAVPEDIGFLQVLNPGSGAVSPEPVSEKRARMLLMQNQQSVELTLTDDRTEEKSDHSEGSPSALPRDDGENGQISPSVTGTLGREGTMLGYEEMWESNAAFAPSSPTSANQEITLSTSHSLPRIEEKAEASEGEQSPSSQTIVGSIVPIIDDVSSSIEIVKSPIGKSICLIPPPVPLAISGKSEEVEDLTKKFPDSKMSSAKRHVRNKSMIFQLPLQNDAALQKESSIPQVHLPSAQAIHDQIINRQLECYDIAIKDLAVSSTSKQEPKVKSLNPITIQALKLSEVSQSDKFIDEGHCIMPDLLAGSKVAALAAAFSDNKNCTELPPKSQSSHDVSLDKNDSVTASDENEEDDDAEIVGSPMKQDGLEKPIRKKRKSLLAMQKLEPTASQGSQGSQGNGNANKDESSSESEEEQAYWGSTGLSKVLRQSTVIRKGEGGLEVDSSNIIPPGGLSLDNIQHISSSESSNEDVTAPMEDIKGSSNFSNLSQPDSKEQKLPDSDADSGASQTDGTPSHSKSHESLLKHHLQIVTAERGRLAETTVELGEKTERLMYELADAREASRARDEVISLLQEQLQRLEESHIKGLEEVHTNRFHLDTRDQELRHLEEVCRKAQGETIHLKEIIRLKDKEILNMTQMRVSRNDEVQLQSIARDREKDMTINELRIHLKYVEQERDRLKDTVVAMERQQASLQTRSEALIEGNARTSAQISKDLRNSQEETNKWRSLYESSLLKLEAIDSTQVKALLDSKTSESETSQSYRNEILCAVERLEKEKEADRQIWQAKIKEEVANAVHLLKSEYEKVEEALRKHNSTLEAMVEKLQIDNDIAVQRRESLENQLITAQDEILQNKRESTELSQLQLELSRLKHQAETDSNKRKLLENELESKDQSLMDLWKTLDILRQEKKELTSLLSETCQRQESKVELEGIQSNLAFEEKSQAESSGIKDVDDYALTINKLLNENNELKQKIDQLNQQIRSLQTEQSSILEQLHNENAKSVNFSLHDNQGAAANKATSEMENTFRQEREELLRQITELRMKLQKRDSSPSSASLCNASAMTDQVRWNQSGLMGVVQKQKEEIEMLKAECVRLRSCNKSPTSTLRSIPPEIKQRPGKPPPTSPRVSPDTMDLLKSTKKRDVEQSDDHSRDYLSPQPYMCKRCTSLLSPNKLPTTFPTRKNSTETQTIEGCESPAHSSKCSSPRHNWNKKKIGNNIEQELQAQAEKCLKHQQMIAGLKSELQLLRGGSCDYPPNLQKQVSDLQQKIKDEMALRSSLEMQLSKMKYEVQEKGQVEKELEKLKGRLEKEFVSRRELDHIKMRARADETSELSTKLAQVNKLLLQQAHDRTSGQAKENVDAQIRKEYEETRQYLVSELAKVQASLQAKENEEKELKLKCEKLSRECDKKNEQRRKMLIEKSYNLGQQFLKEKNPGNIEQKVSPLFTSVSETTSHNKQVRKEPNNLMENPYSQLLRKEVKKSAEKYKTAEAIPDLSSGTKSEERMNYLKKKYCLP